jgi:hypothetical protein
MADSHREQGSEFHWEDFEPVGKPVSHPWHDSGTLWGSGRDALRALLEWGGEHEGWRRLWCPSFFCQEVVAALQTAGLKILAYADAPAEVFTPPSEGELQDGDTILVMNFFGLREQVSYRDVPDEVIIIEDHSHDPWSRWSRSSRANWCVASLRKTLPVPDGGALWSPKKLDGPERTDVSAARARAADQKLSAMVLKGLYLQGHPVEKPVFRELSVAAEEHIASGEVSGISAVSRQLLATFPVADWRTTRRRNHRVLTDGVSGLKQLEDLQPSGEDDVPFSGIFVFESRGLRESVRQYLIDNRVYPAILWTLDEPHLDGIPPEHVELAGRTFSIHCDMRYDVTDMERVARLIRQSLS